jgi:hypothetical protein
MDWCNSMQFIQHDAINAPDNLSTQQYGPFQWLHSQAESLKQVSSTISLLVIGQGLWTGSFASTLQIIIKPSSRGPRPFLRPPLCSAPPNQSSTILISWLPHMFSKSYYLSPCIQAGYLPVSKWANALTRILLSLLFYSLTKSHNLSIVLTTMRS